MNTYFSTSFKAMTAMAALITCGHSALAATELYFRPEAGIAGFGDSHYEGSESYGLSGACRFNDEGQHELSIEWSTTKLEYSDLPPAGVIGGSGTWMNGRLHNVLLGYRYNFGKRENQWRAFCGPLAGLAINNSDASYVSDSAYGLWKGSVRKCGVALGAVGGVDFRMNKGTSLQLGLRYLGMPDLGQTQLEQMNGATTRQLEVGSVSSLTLFLGVNFKL